MNCLVASPHMDDEVMSCGGTIAKHVAHGDFVTVCVVANRAYGHAYDPEKIHEELDDGLAAKKVLGYQGFHYLGQPDEQVGVQLIGLVSELECVIEIVKPDIIYLPWKGDVNQDHRAVWEAAMVACRPHAARFVSSVYAYESMSSSPHFGQFAPNHYVDISGDHVELKKKAMACYRRESRAWPHPRSPEGIEALARKRGMEAGLEFAEAFMNIRSVWR